MGISPVKSTVYAIEDYLKGGDKLRKTTSIVLVVLLSLSQMHTTTGASKINILIDESRVYVLEEEVKELFIEEMMSEILNLTQSIPGMSSSDLEEALDLLFKTLDSSYSFNNYIEPWGFGDIHTELKDMGEVTVKDSETLTYTTLRNYDVLIIASFEESYSSSEIEAIKQFVENGGGVFILGDVNSQNNSVSAIFDVLFESGEAFIADKTAEKYTTDIHQIYVSEITDHPITRGINQIALNGAIPIQSYDTGTALMQTSSASWLDRAGSGFGTKDGIEENGPFTILLAQNRIGRGRAVFFGGVMTFWNGVLYDSDQQNEELFINIVQWLGESGGPYKQSSTMRDQAKAYFSNGKALFFNSHDFEAAKERFGQAIDLFEQSHALFTWNDTTTKIEEAQSYIEKCETGLEANDIFDTAEDLFQQRTYEDAIIEYENAKALYEEIEYSDRVTECSQKIEESNQWTALHEEASTKLQKAEDSLSSAPSSISPSGYEHSKSLFEEAKSAWEDYDDPEKVALCREKIEFCEQEMNTIEQRRMIIMVMGVIAVAGIIGGILIMRKRKSTVKEEAPEESESSQPSEES
jgi:tetratricopeptide (TPR) repeat protein